MRVLVTGITGFAGSHLAEYLLAEHPDVAVYGTVRWRSRMENLEDLRRTGKLDQIEGADPGREQGLVRVTPRREPTLACHVA